jgi:hypothetical protein
MARDPKIEQWLTSEGVEFRYHPTVLVSKIDRQASLSNQARMTGKVLNQEMAQEYAEAMAQSELAAQAFPAMVGFMMYDAKGQPLGRYILATGNHRLEASNLIQRQYFDLYEVLTRDAYLRDMLTRTANNVEGARPDREESLQHAVFLITTYGRTILEMSRRLRVPEHAIETAVRLDKTVKRLEAEGINPDSLSRSAIIRLAAIHNANVLRELGSLATKAKMSEPMIGEVIKAIKQHSTEQKQIEEVQRWGERDDIKRRVAQTRNGSAIFRQEEKVQMWVSLARLERQLERCGNLQRLQFTDPADITRLRETWQRVNSQFNNLFQEPNALAASVGAATR